MPGSWRKEKGTRLPRREKEKGVTIRVVGGKRLMHAVRRAWSVEENENEGMLQVKQDEQ